MGYRLLEVDLFSRNYDVLRRLGAGGFGVTYLCRNKVDDTTYAVKVIPCSAQKTKKALRECKTMAILKHENIVRYHTAWMEAGFPSLVQEFVGGILANNRSEKVPTRTMYIAMEYCPRVLSEEIQKGTLSDDEVENIFYGVARGLASIHKSGFVHCDVHPGNIFLDQSGNPKIGDFGLSRKIDEGDMEVEIGKGLYQPTEIWALERPTPGADMYSFALSMLEMTCSLKGEKVEEVFGDAKAGLFPRELVERRDMVYAAIQQILTASKSERMEASEICKNHKG